MELGKLADALHFVEESLLRGWHDMKARSLKASILLHLEGESENYQQFLKDSLEIDPLYLSLLYRLDNGEKFMQATGGRMEEVLSVAYEFIEFSFWQDAKAVLNGCNVEHPLKYYALAYACGKMNALDEAVSWAERAETFSTDLCFPNKTLERQILEYAVSILTNAAKAHYYLGELLYDKRQYDTAIAHWKLAVAQMPEMAAAHRNLSIAYYNHANRALAAQEIAEACRLEPDNSRFLLEQDQLLKRLDAPIRERLAHLEAHESLLSQRYALMLAYVSLLNADGQYAKALYLMTHYTFHIWEGGEGKVADEYKIALFALAEKALSEGKPQEAIAYAERTLVYPVNLGEGKLDNVPDNHAHYLMGEAYRALGDEATAKVFFEKATLGAQEPEPVRYYNDQPSDYIYWQGLAFHALGHDEQAKKSFHQLISFGDRHIFDHVEYDFFAVSMPELEVYQDDLQKRSDDYCRRMTALGHKGLQKIQEND